MKCFTLSSHNLFLPEPERSGVANFGLETYPNAVRGIRLDPRDRCVVFSGGKRVRVSDDLLKVSDPAAILRSGPHCTVYRADIKVGDDGVVTLVPESGVDSDFALVFVDIVGSPHIKYEGDAEFIPVRFSETDLGDTHECALLKLKPFEPVTAVRSGNRWGLKAFGIDKTVYEKQRLPIIFDGHNVSYEIRNVG